MRKSKIINLTLATSVSAWALASCSEPTPAPKAVTETAPIFTTVAECVAGGNTEQLCKTSIEQAQAAVPRFSAKAQCEAEYGVGNCESRSSSNGGGDWFGPAMAGFFVGQMMNGGIGGGGNYNRGYEEGRRDEERRNGGSYARGSAAPVIVGRGGALSSGGRSLGVTATRNSNGTYSAPRQATVTRSYTSSTTRGGFGRSAGARGSVGG